MYLSEIYLQNTGPITKCHVEMPFADNGNPFPVVIVGPNGSGKSVFLSYIVDALMEFAKTAFRDIVPSDGLHKPYFRIISSSAIKSGAAYSISLLHFKTAEKDLHYCEKSGHLDSNATHLSNFKSQFQSVWNWQLKDNHKKVSARRNDKAIVKTEMNNNAHVFFPANRREYPDWLNRGTLPVGPNATLIGRFNNQLEKPLQVETSGAANAAWVLDVLVDSMIDLQLLKSSGTQIQNYVNLHQVYAIAKRNVEQILKTILRDKSAALRLNLRNVGYSRITLIRSNGQIIPSLQSLSEGESQLFNLFCTIIRYAERTNVARSFDLASIKGIVLIDEIDAHLHPSLQHEVVPKLIKLFPKVQFILSSHSPLFLLGMEKKFGPDGIKILELPTGTEIPCERYSEFGNAFDYYQETVRFQEELENRIKAGTKPLLLTEGPLDVRYIKTAITRFGKSDLLTAIDFEAADGSGNLDKILGFYKKNPSLLHRPIMLLYDCDAKQEPKEVGKLWVRRIQSNPENQKVLKGVENLFPGSLFEDSFYQEEPSPKGDGGINKTLDKNAFCNWICAERKDNADFDKFESVILILEEFVAAHESEDEECMRTNSTTATII